MSKIKPEPIAILNCFILLFFLTGCNLMQGVQNTSPNEENLRRRVSAVWQAKVDKDWKKVYSMLDKAAQKDMSPENYAASQSHFIAYSFSIAELNISDKGTGTSLVVFKTTLMGMPFDISVRDNWVWEDNSWRLTMPKLTPFSNPSHPVEGGPRHHPPTQ